MQYNCKKSEGKHCKLAGQEFKFTPARRSLPVDFTIAFEIQNIPNILGNLQVGSWLPATEC